MTCSRNVAEPAALYLAQDARNVSRFSKAPRYHNFPTFNGDCLSGDVVKRWMDGWMDGVAALVNRVQAAGPKWKLVSRETFPVAARSKGSLSFPRARVTRLNDKKLNSILHPSCSSSVHRSIVASNYTARPSLP